MEALLGIPKRTLMAVQAEAEMAELLQRQEQQIPVEAVVVMVVALLVKPVVLV